MSVAMNFTFWPVFISPFTILKYASIPLKVLYTESKIIACNGASASPSGAGTLSTIPTNISSMPIPVLALAAIISSSLQSIKSII